MQKVATKLTTPNMIFQNKETCLGCQREVEVYDIQIIGGPDKGAWQKWKKGCICENIKLAKQAEANAEIINIRKMKDMFNRNSLISKDLVDATFESFEPQNDKQEYAKRVAVRYAEVFDLEDPKNLLFHGSFGLGKSHLAKCIADEVMKKRIEGDSDKKGYSAIFISIPKLLRKIRSTYSNDSDVNEDEIITTLEQVDCLILDDLGAEKTSDWTVETIFDIIDSRQGKHTIYTTNYSPEDLINKIGERNFSRVINQDTTALGIDGKNHRLKNFGGNES